LLIGYLGNPRRIAFAGRVRRVIYALPPEVTFTCKNAGNSATVVSATVYNPAKDEEKTIAAYYYSEWLPTPLTWTGGSPRSAIRMRRAFDTEITINAAFFLFLFIPATAVGVWLILAVDWRWAWALLLFVEMQVVFACVGVMFFYQWRIFLAFAGAFFSNRLG